MILFIQSDIACIRNLCEEYVNFYPRSDKSMTSVMRFNTAKGRWLLYVTFDFIATIYIMPTQHIYLFCTSFGTTAIIYVHSFNWLTYTECPRRNVPHFGRVFLMLKYTDITQNTYVQSWTVTEIMARDRCGLLAGPRTVPVSWQSYPCPSLSVVSYYGNSAHACSKLLMYFLLGDKVVHVSAWHSCHV